MAWKIDWSAASSTREAKIAGSGNFGISSGTRNRAPITARNTKVSPVLIRLSRRFDSGSAQSRPSAPRDASPAAGEAFAPVADDSGVMPDVTDVVAGTPD